MRLFSKKNIGFFIMMMVIVLPSCVRLFSGSDFMVYRTAKESYNEQFVFDENNVKARIVWKQNIGTLNALFFSEPKYIIGADLAFVQDDKIYAQDQYNIFTLDARTGKTVKQYDKPFKPPVKEIGIINLSQPCRVPGGTIFLVKDAMNEPREFVILDDKDKHISYKYVSPDTTTFCVGDKAVIIRTSFMGDGFQVSDIRGDRKLWWSGEFLRFFYSAELNNGTLLTFYRKGNSLYVESYDFNYVAQAEYGISDKRLLWQCRFDRHIALDKNKIAGFKDLNALLVLDEIFAVEYSYINEATGEITEQVTSIDPETGSINWQKYDVVRVDSKRYGKHDGLFYLSKKGEQDTIYGIDQKTGEEKLKVFLKGYNSAQGIISLPDKLYYAGASASGDNPLIYKTFSAVDKKTGKTLWSITVDQQHALPYYANGVFYFGLKKDFYSNLVEGTLTRYAHSFDLYSKQDVLRGLSKTAYAVDAQTGNVLWKIRLDGGDESYIEKILVKDDMAFIKSLSGWLYAIEWGKGKFN